ncbi:hypothetical protein AB0C07_03900 [Actinoplanes missouriensis]|uniref:hypothetical protein n=1 Tax=Actinoplanes missouriensis TaxID=1866 RepID=UPI0033DD9D65
MSATPSVTPTPSKAPARAAAAAAACGGELTLGSPVTCASISGTQKHTYTVRTTVDGERLLTNFDSGGSSAQARLNLPDGESCFLGPYSGGCVVPDAGVHTIDVYLYYGEGTASYGIGVESWQNPSSCVTVDSFAVNGPVITGELPRGAAGDCYRIDGEAGMRLTVETTHTAASGSTHSPDVRGWMEGPDGEQICPIQFGGGNCVLERDGAYRVFLADEYGGAVGYTFRLVRTDVVTGCDVLEEAAFGTPSAGQVASGSIPSYEYRCYAVSLTAGLKYVQVHNGGLINWELTGPDGAFCGKYITEYEPCQVPADGVYTLWLRHPDWSYEPTPFSASIVGLDSSEGCATATGTAWDQPTDVITPGSPVDLWCRPFTAAAGERVRAYVSGGGLSWITDGTGARICDGQDSDQDGCVLPGSGPYRVMGEADGDDEIRVQVRSLSAPVGCPVITPGAYGGAPAGAHGGVRCRSLTVPAAGRHLVRVVDDENNESWAQIYDAAGDRFCSAGYFCDFTKAGSYTLVYGSAADGSPYTTVFLAPNGSGCVPVTDQGVAGGSFRGSFTVAGETDCLELSSPAGATISVIRPARSNSVESTLINGAGEDLCSSYSCKLTGPAPYRVLLSAPEGAKPGDYAVVVQRRDHYTGCGTLPLTAIGTNTGVTSAFSADKFVSCYAIPAAQHATKELLSFAPVAGSGAATLSVVDADGKQVCGSSLAVSAQLLHCDLAAGKAYTAVLTAMAANVQYRLIRRDASPAGAKCQTPASTVLGGPAAAGTLTAPDDVRCYRVSTTAATTFWLGVRSGTDYAARYWVSNAAGTMLCSGYVAPCQVNGSTSYQVFVWTAKAGTAVPYRFDAWNLATGGKPAAQCQTAYGAPGFGPLTGTLNDQRTAACVAVPVKSRNAFTARVTNTAGGDALPESRYFLLTGKNEAILRCSLTCSVYTSYPATTGTALFVVAPPTAGGTYPYRVDTSCESEPCAIPYVLGSVSPASAANSGPVNLSLRGNGLSATDTVTLTRSGSVTIKAAVRSYVNGTLTVTADVTNAAAGAWNVTVRSAKDGRTATLPGAITVRATALKPTKAPAISGTVRVGSTVKAVTGTWSPAATAHAYQWSVNGVAIKGATGSTYLISASQRGKRLSVTVTAKRANRLNSPAVSAGVSVGWGVAPAAKTKPSITGTVKAGKTVKVKVGVWSPSATSYRYEWRLNGKVIKGATASSLKIKSAWKGKKLTVVVTARRAGHYDGKATSAALKIK